MSLTPQGATLIIYLAANIFMTYTNYCAMRIFFDQPPAHRWRAWASYGLYFAGVSLAYLLVNKPLLTLAANIVLLVVISANYDGSWQRRIAAVAFAIAVAFLCEMITVVIIDAAGAAHFTRFNDQAFIVAQIISRTLSYFAILLISKLDLLHGYEQTPQISWAVVIAVPICTVLPVLTLIMIGNENELPFIALCIIALFAINMLVFYLYDKIAQLYQENLKSMLTAQQAQAYAQQIKQYQEQQEKERQLRHDLRNHYAVLKGIVNQDAKAYLQELLAELDLPTETVATGLAALDALLNFKLAEAQQAAIRIEKQLIVPTRLQTISDNDLCAALGNLLDNTIRAAGELPSDQRWLRLAITYHQQVLTICVTNPYQGSLRQRGSRLLTTKDDPQQHGIGLRSVERIAQKYDGDFQTHHEQQIFTAELWLSDATWSEND